MTGAAWDSPDVLGLVEWAWENGLPEHGGPYMEAPVVTAAGERYWIAWEDDDERT